MSTFGKVEQNGAGRVFIVKGGILPFAGYSGGIRSTSVDD
jgi:hypothetical protein